MIGELFNNPFIFVFWLIALIIAITVHEFAHAWAADRLGDPTPRLMGRLTLNPMAHLDPIGTLMIVFARFGWGKPVTFDPYNLRNPRRDAALISIAGPISNILTAILCAAVLHVLLALRLSILAVPAAGFGLLLLTGLLQTIISLNVVLAVFNLVPIHPLDGFKIVGGILPEHYAKQWYELESYGIWFLIILLFISPTSLHTLIDPIINLILTILLPTAGAV